MTTSLDSVLVPVDVSEPVSVGGTLAEALPLGNAVFLGYWKIPDQSSSDQHRRQFGEEAEDRLHEAVDSLTDSGTETEPRTHLSFTKDRNHLIDRATNEYGCGSVLNPGAVSDTSAETERKRGIVLVKPDADLDRMTETLGELFADTEVELLLFHDVETENEHLYDATEHMLRGMTDRLGELGIDRDRTDWEQSTEESRISAILSRVSGFDFVVLSETEPSVRERVFGSVQSALADETDKPLLTVRSGV